MGYNITIKEENRICLVVINNKQVFPEVSLDTMNMCVNYVKY